MVVVAAATLLAMSRRKQLPDVDVGGDDERIERALARLGVELAERAPRTRSDTHSRCSRRPKSMHRPEPRVPRLQGQQADHRIAGLLVILDQIVDQAADVARRAGAARIDLRRQRS